MTKEKKINWTTLKKKKSFCFKGHHKGSEKKNSMDLIHATYLFLLDLELLCISLLCFCLKPDLVVALETVKSQHRQDLLAFTKKEKERKKAKVKSIHFIIR